MMEEHKELSPLEAAFLALWEFCTTEMDWDYFRAEMLSDTVSGQNAAKIRDYLESLRAQCPIVDECLSKHKRPE